MTAAPMVSVVMSCYNARRWLPEAIDSVLSQTYTDLELVLVDDGSQDGTLSIIEDYRSRDTRVVAIAKNNTGLADSLNIGIQAARGTWIARLDADDVSEPTRITEQVKFVNDNAQVVLVGSAFRAIDESGRETMVHRYPSTHKTLIRNLEQIRRFFPHSSAFFRRSVVHRLGGYNVRFRKTQDWDLWFRLAESGEIACIDVPIVRVREHSERISSSAPGTSQLVYATVAATCHFLRLRGEEDPSLSDSEFQKFVAWVQQRMSGDGMMQRRAARKEARDTLFARSSRVAGAWGAAKTLLSSGQTFALLRETLFGLALPRELAMRWAAESRGA